MKSFVYFAYKILAATAAKIVGMLAFLVSSMIELARAFADRFQLGLVFVAAAAFQILAVGQLRSIGIGCWFEIFLGLSALIGALSIKAYDGNVNTKHLPVSRDALCEQFDPGRKYPAATLILPSRMTKLMIELCVAALAIFAFIPLEWNNAVSVFEQSYSAQGFGLAADMAQHDTLIAMTCMFIATILTNIIVVEATEVLVLANENRCNTMRVVRSEALFFISDEDVEYVTVPVIKPEVVTYRGTYNEISTILDDSREDAQGGLPCTPDQLERLTQTTLNQVRAGIAVPGWLLVSLGIEKEAEKIRNDIAAKMRRNEISRRRYG